MSKNIHSDLNFLINEVKKTQYFKITCDYRGKTKQEECFKNGTSRARFGQSPHNYKPSFAIDIIPQPFKGWNDLVGFNRVLNEFLRIAKENNIQIALGRDFTTIKDFPHIELKNWKKYAKK